MVAMRDGAIAQLRRGVIEFCVLALLRDGERYGFELVRTLSAADGMVTTEGTLYPLLSKLRREELLDYDWVESDQGPPRKYYKLTDKGSTRLDDLAAYWAQLTTTLENLGR